MTDVKRWKATATYRHANGSEAVEHFVEELDELSDFIERGPDWNCLEKLVVVLNRPTSPGLTVEASLELVGADAHAIH